MVDKNLAREKFSSRLHHALDLRGVRRRGRGVDIHRRLKADGVYKTPQAVSKWLNGEAMPESESMAALCSWLGVRREWLEYGVVPVEHSTFNAEVYPETSTANQEFKTAVDQHRVPLVTWASAKNRCNRTGQFCTSEVESWIYCPVKISKNGYALTVIGDSMVNPSAARDYPIGSIIFVDPDVNSEPGNRVIARVPNSAEITFKVLVEDAGRYFLKPINLQYPIIEVTGSMHICGKVIGSFIID